MLNKNELKDIQSLGLKKHREEKGWFLAEGPKVVRELAELVPQSIHRIYALPAWAEENRTWLHGLPHSLITDVELSRISQMQTPNQVLAVLHQFAVAQPKEDGFCLYLDGIQDPGNFGTIIRIADWFGIGQVVAGPGTADMYNPKVVQSTMASIARVQVYYDEGAHWLESQARPIYAAVLDGQSIHTVEKRKDGILLIGNESKGLSDALIKKATHKITIPRIGEAESLNAAVATGIIVSHLLVN